LFTALTSSGTITFWLRPASLKRRISDKVARLYTVDPAYRAWGAEGVLAFIIAVHFDEVSTARFLGIPVETPSSRAVYRQAATDWLTSRSYPSDLIEPVRSTNSPNQAMQRTAPRSDA
jgi:hypothetical protein